MFTEHLSLNNNRECRGKTSDCKQSSSSCSKHEMDSGGGFYPTVINNNPYPSPSSPGLGSNWNRAFGGKQPVYTELFKNETLSKSTLSSQNMPNFTTASTVVSPTVPYLGHLKLTADEDLCKSPPYDSEASSPSGTTPSCTSAAPNSPTCQSAKPDQPPINFGHNYSDYYVKTGKLPQTWLRNLNEPLMGYPKLQKLHNLKKEHNDKYAHPPIGIQRDECSMPGFIDQLAKDGVQFDVVMVHGCFDVWPYKSLQALKIEKITARPSLIFLWVPSAKIQDGRQLLDQWGFRKGEDITYMVRSLDSRYTPDSNVYYHQSTLFKPTTWHCLMGLKGTLRRSSDNELINCNVDTDVIIEKLDQPSNVVPPQIYSIIENFTSMGRKLHIVPTASPENLPIRSRAGWVTVAPNTWSIGTLNPKNYRQRILIPFSDEIDLLRPQTPTTERRRRN